MAGRVEASLTEGESTIEERDREAMREFEEGLDQPMDEEANMLKNMNKEKGLSMLMLLRLSFQSLGIVYGELGTSPLYVFYNTFPDGIDDSEDVIGALSLIIYSLLLIPLIKYVFIVCKANDNGQAGGTLAIYSLLCRHANVNLIPNQQRRDEDLSTYSRTLVAEGSFASKTKKWLESRHSKKRSLLVIVLLGTCMMIGDSILTPAISVLSATGGIKVNNPKMSSDISAFVSVVILIGLFSMQHYGTDKVGWLFAPIVLIWFLFIGATGIYNICKHDTRVLKAFSPTYIYLYFKRRGQDGWISLGGILLSITGTEALYADISYFPLQAIQLAFTLFVFPCLLLAYCGQAAYLVNHKEHYQDAFYASIPESVYWPMFIAATGAAIVGSQATISGTYSLIKQAVSHGCFPPIYCPDINWILMIGCIAVTASFKNQIDIGNAYDELLMVKPISDKYGYKDLHRKDDRFEDKLFENLFSFIQNETMMESDSNYSNSVYPVNYTQESRDELISNNNNNHDSIDNNMVMFSSMVDYMDTMSFSQNNTVEEEEEEEEEDELEFLKTCKESGVVHIMENTVVKARKGSLLPKKIAIDLELYIDYVYAFLAKICRENSAILHVPHETLLNVGQVYYL
ncbi:unnamed protein product [Brassica rapa subsp. trilocularis]